MKLNPSGREHVAAVPTTREHYVMAFNGEFPEGEVLPWSPPDGSETVLIVFVPKPDAQGFCSWLERRDREAGFFGPDHYYRLEPLDGGIAPTLDDTTRNNLAFRIVAGLREFGDLRIESVPSGAEIFEDGKRIGATPLDLPRRLIGPVKFELRLAGHNPEVLSAEIEPGQSKTLKRELTRNALAVFDQEWRNSLGMTFHPVDDMQVCIWETRVRDFDAWMMALGRTHQSDLDQTPDHPVVDVTRDDAIAFCRWLTEKERAERRLEPAWEYRLPTDIEWSRAAGLAAERGDTPSARNARIKGVYAWGFVWPPPPTAGNFADQAAGGRVRLENSTDRLLAHNDTFTFTAPVGSFAPNRYGLFDLAGNVWEWVSEDFGGNTANTNYSTFGVLRGAGWAD
jgi:hypothetical protein